MAERPRAPARGASFARVYAQGALRADREGREAQARSLSRARRRDGLLGLAHGLIYDIFIASTGSEILAQHGPMALERK